MKVSFLLSYSPGPRIKKRIEVTRESYNTSLIFWKRSDVNIWGEFNENIESIGIEISASGSNPLSRITPTIIYAYKAIRYLNKIKPDCIHVENLDMLMIANIYRLGKRKKTKIIYEVADVHSLLIDPQKNIIKRFLQKVLKGIDAFLCKKIDLLVNTSDMFYKDYFSNFVPQGKLIVMPNMPNLSVFEEYRKKRNGKFTVGFIGAIRYKDQMKMLIHSAEESQTKVLFAGSSFDNEIKDACEGKSWINYYGGYDHTTEIANLYGMVDCVYSVYDADLYNVRIALPNKLYEAIYCELPIIVAKGTYLGELVQKMGIGVAVNHKNKKELESVLTRLSNDSVYYNSFVEACRKHKDEINLDVYNKRLKLAIDKIMAQ